MGFFCYFELMKPKKVFKAIGYVLISLLVIFVCILAYTNYTYKHKFIPNENVYSHSAEYINPKEAIFNDNFYLCDEKRIFQYYNPERATYSEGKNGLRKFVLSNYVNKGYSDSGYLNFRFIINCKGEAGRYVFHENDLELNPKPFNKDLVKQLLKITTQLKKWNPNYVQEEFRDSYMYISYRIENGEITEIIP